MTITNISTYGSLQTTLQYIGNVQGDLNSLQLQVYSSRRNQAFDTMSSSVEQFTSLNAQIDRFGNYQQINSIISGQLQTTNTSLTQVTQLATSVKSLIASQVSGTSSDASFKQQLQAQMNTLTSLLNTSYSGNFLFGGTNTNTPPVKTPLPANVQLGVPDSGYYQGSSRDVTARISDSQSITPNVRADALAFQQLFAGLQQALDATSKSGTPRSDALKSAEDLVDKGLDGAIALQATVNANILIVKDATSQIQTLQSYYKGIISDINDSDVVALSARISQDSTVLQASYSVFSRISQLNLGNYLK